MHTNIVSRYLQQLRSGTKLYLKSILLIILCYLSIIAVEENAKIQFQFSENTSFSHANFGFPEF